MPLLSADIFFSQMAVGIYAILLLVLFIVLIIAVIRYEKNAITIPIFDLDKGDWRIGCRIEHIFYP